MHDLPCLTLKPYTMLKQALTVTFKSGPNGTKLDATPTDLNVDGTIDTDFRLIREGAIRSTVSGQMRILCTIAIPVMG